MTMVLNVYYKEKTGDIVGYQKGESLTPLNEIPPGCLRAAYMDADIWGPNFHVNMKVDVATKKLVPINDPEPIDETHLLPDLERKIEHAKEELIMASKDEGMTEYRDYLKTHIDNLQLKIDQMRAQMGTVEITHAI